MRKTFKIAAATTMTAGVLAGGLVATPAQAAVIQDGLVNVKVGDVTILKNVDIAVAANVVATICGLQVGPVAALGTVVDNSGARDVVCRVDGAPIIIRQNR